MHLTKRFGIVAVSQLPVQYTLALKRLRPVARVLRSSHEAVNRWHRALGCAIYLLLALHAVFYLNYFFQNGILARRTTDLVPLLGEAAFVGLTALVATSAPLVRARWSYRVFFVTHLVVAVLLPALVMFHHPRNTVFYAVEAIGLFVLDIALRNGGNMFTAPAHVTFIPARESEPEDSEPEAAESTDLVKLVVAVPKPGKMEAFRRAPGAHVYLSLPSASRPSRGSGFLFDFLFNPFTVAALGEDPNGNPSLILVARRRSGPMTRHLARLADANTTGAKRVSLSIEGPYGCASWIAQDLTARNRFDRILLVAGGVGASFIIPLYRHIIAENPSDTRVRLVWAVRRASDTAWVSDEGGNVLDDNRVQLFVTGKAGAPGASNANNDERVPAPEEGDEEIEMRPMLDGGKSGTARPDLQGIVDEVFRRGSEERVAVLVCGPENMARELRSHVGAWVARGRTVFWHNEGFGW